MKTLNDSKSMITDEITREALKIMHKQYQRLHEQHALIFGEHRTYKSNSFTRTLSNWKHRLHKCWQVLRYDADLD